MSYVPPHRRQTAQAASAHTAATQAAATQATATQATATQAAAAHTAAAHTAAAHTAAAHTAAAHTAAALLVLSDDQNRSICYNLLKKEYTKIRANMVSGETKLSFPIMHAGYYNYCNTAHIRSLPNGNAGKVCFQSFGNFVSSFCAYDDATIDVCAHDSSLVNEADAYVVQLSERPRAGVLICKKNGDCLLAKTQSSRGSSLILMKGGVDENETLQLAAIREVLEEGGLTIRLAPDVRKFTFNGRGHPDVFPSRVVENEITIFYHQVPDDYEVDLTFTSSETKGLQWLTPLEMKISKEITWNVKNTYNKLARNV
jgi:8-oxo-dGTP pyrophosphatase MutT (NUDIX family)